MQNIASAAPDRTFSLRALLADQTSRFENHLQYMNPQLPRVLKTLGFDRKYVRGEGPYLWDEEGNRYLDLLSGYGVFNLGRYHPKIVAAMKEMLEIQDANLVQFDCPHLLGLLAKALLNKTPSGGRVYFCSTGAEAVETAIKFARAHTKKHRILFLDHSFHGLTTGALSLNGNHEFRDGFGPLFSDLTDAIPMSDLARLEMELRKKDVAAFIFEPIQGKGVFIPEQGYLKEAEALCRKYGALTIADEIQTGIGRTGRFFAFEHENIDPDMILLSKSLGGGLIPTGAVIARDAIFRSVFSKMDRCVVHSSSFGKNSLSAAMGLATLHILDEEKLCERAEKIGAEILRRVSALKEKYEMLGDVRGRGCMIGFEFRSPKSIQLKMGWTFLHSLNKGLFPQLIVVPLMRDHRILTQTSGHNQDIVKILPSLVIADEDIDYFVSAFDDVLRQAHKFPGAIWDLGKTLAKAALSDRQAASCP